MHTSVVAFQIVGLNIIQTSRLNNLLTSKFDAEFESVLLFFLGDHLVTKVTKDVFCLKCTKSV